MNMNRKKLFTILFVVSSFFVFKNNTYAVDLSCRQLSEAECSPLPTLNPDGSISTTNTNCKWSIEDKMCIGKNERTFSCESLNGTEIASTSCNSMPGCELKSSCVEKSCDKNDEEDCINSLNCYWEDSLKKCLGNNNSETQDKNSVLCISLNEEKCNKETSCYWDNESNSCISGVKCEKLTSKNECDIYRKCHWADSNRCIEQYVASAPCEDNNIKNILRFFGYLIQVARIAIPLIIVILGTFDLFQSVVDKDEKLLGKKVKQIGLRILGGVFIFFIPSIVDAVFSLSTYINVNTEQYEICEKCLLHPGEDECKINKSNNTNNNNTNSNNTNNNNTNNTTTNNNNNTNNNNTNNTTTNNNNSTNNNNVLEKIRLGANYCNNFKSAKECSEHEDEGCVTGFVNNQFECNYNITKDKR